MRSLRRLGFALAVTLAPAALAASGAAPAPAAAPPPATPAPPAAPAPGAKPALVCPSGQACGDKCISWTEVCTPGLAASLGYAPPSTSAAPQASGAPAGSTVIGLPQLNEATAPGMREGAPPWCLTGSAMQQPPVECMAFYRLGSGESATPAAKDQDCPQHLKCAGVCLKEGQVCPAVQPNQSKRLDPYDPATPTSTPIGGQ